MRTFLIAILLLKSCTAYAGDEDSAKVRKFGILIFPAIGYAPETRWYLGAATLFKTRFSIDSLQKPSTLQFEFNITQNKQYIFTEDHELWFSKNKWLVTGNNGYFKYPEDYWGIGKATTDNLKVSYDANRIEIDNSVYYEAMTDLYVGLRYRYHNMDVKKSEDEYLPPELYQYELLSSGIGPALIFDQRDNVLNATKGARVSLSFLTFAGWMGSKADFWKLDFDFRHYWTLADGQVLAFQGIYSGSEGDVPFRMLPLLGGENIMRGYYTGRYRDKHFYAGQLEYRARLYKWFGLAAFAGWGEVTGTHTGGEAPLKYSLGGGIRIRVDKKDNVNLRFDYAAGNGSDGFYVSFGEAF